MKKIAANKNYRTANLAVQAAKGPPTPKLARYIESLESKGWSVTMNSMNTGATLAYCTDGTDNCNMKTLYAMGTATRGGIDNDGNGSEAIIEIRYRESWYKEPE